MPTVSAIRECCGCGRFKACQIDTLDLPACSDCAYEWAKGRVWDRYRRCYVPIGSGHDWEDEYTHDDGRRSDAAGRL